MDSLRFFCDVYTNWYALAPIVAGLLCVTWYWRREYKQAAIVNAMGAAANPYACMVASDPTCLPPPPTYTHDGLRYVVNDGHWHM